MSLPIEPIDLLLLTILSGILVYIFFWPTKADLARILGIEEGITQETLDSKIDEHSLLKRQRRITILVTFGLVIVGLCLGSITRIPLLIAIFTVAAVIYLWVSAARRYNPTKAMHKVFPRLLLNLTTVLQENQNLLESLRVAVQDEDEGPVFQHIRDSLLDVAVQIPLTEVLRNLADYYRYEPFTNLIRILERTIERGSDPLPAILELEKQVYIERRTQAMLSIAKRALTILAVGVVGLLPALICVILVPLLIPLIPPEALPDYLRLSTTPVPLP
jgi:Flp pilus assembly protein TadB